MKQLLVDPPEGWKYGFPKIVENDESPNEEWFLKNGYPQELINEGMLNHTRFWLEEENDTKL